MNDFSEESKERLWPISFCLTPAGRSSGVSPSVSQGDVELHSCCPVLPQGWSLTSLHPHSPLPSSLHLLLLPLVCSSYWIITGQGRRRRAGLHDNLSTPACCLWTSSVSSGPMSSVLRLWISHFGTRNVRLYYIFVGFLTLTWLTCWLNNNKPQYFKGTVVFLQSTMRRTF